ncbi:inositol-pentakisphosphate 2-kinase [Cyathus striatus]|nr:inositol-pentakisphosphate 2-kinase [Cyathus striatus]
MPAVNITDSSPSDWKYVSEGGATIVFSYSGPPDPRFDGTVLRLRKALVPRLPLVNNEFTAETTDEPDDPTIEYQEKCMFRLIPPKHLPRLETVLLDRLWLEQLHDLQQSRRPQSRVDKDCIDFKRKKGVLATDLVGGNWLAVEIKPKWAFLPSLTHLSDGTRPIKSQTCRFCMHARMKSSEGEQVPLGYCPLDLFSGNEDRITNALTHLWDSWCESNGTINNLKIFSRGKLVSPTKKQQILAGDDDGRYSSDDIRDAFVRHLRQPLLCTPVLRILSNLQRSLDALDIEGLAELWRLTESTAARHRTEFHPFFKDSDGLSTEQEMGVSSLFLSEPEPDINDWIEFLNTFQSSFGHEIDNANPSPENLRYYLMAYLLGATFKDCSIIVQLDFVRPGKNAEDKTTEERVTVIDLDPKQMSKLSGWEKLDRKIVKAYGKYSPDERKQCIDDRGL